MPEKKNNINAEYSKYQTEFDQEPQEPKPNINRTGPIANTRNRNGTEPKPHYYIIYYNIL